MELTRIVGIVGLLLVAGGVLARRAEQRNSLFAIGGTLLLVYSIQIGDLIFAILEFIFAGSAAYELWRTRHHDR